MLGSDGVEDSIEQFSNEDVSKRRSSSKTLIVLIVLHVRFSAFSGILC